MLVGLFSIALGIAIILREFNDNIIFFYTASELANAENHTGRIVKLGGMIAENSIKREGQIVHFIITDFEHEIPAIYEGITPALFAEKQGVVAIGKYSPADNQFVAKEILAKHDEQYMPPNLKIKSSAIGNQ